MLRNDCTATVTHLDGFLSDECAIVSDPCLDRRQGAGASRDGRLVAAMLPKTDGTVPGELGKEDGYM